MKFDDVIIINKVLELYTKFERDNYSNYSNHDSHLIFRAERHNEYWMCIKFDFTDNNQNFIGDVNINIHNGSFKGYLSTFQKCDIENKKFDTMEQLENLLYDIANKEYEEVLNEA